MISVRPPIFSLLLIILIILSLSSFSGLLRSLRFFRVLEPILAMLWCGESRFFQWFLLLHTVFFFKIFGTVPSTPTTTGNTATFLFQSLLVFFCFFLFSGKVKIFSSTIHVFICLFTFFYFHSGIRWNGKVLSMISSFYFLILCARCCLLARIRCSICFSKSQRSLCVSFSRTDSGLCIYHLVKF